MRLFRLFQASLRNKLKIPFQEENEMAKGDYDDENLIWIKYTKAPLRKTLWRIKVIFCC